MPLDEEVLNYSSLTNADIEDLIAELRIAKKKYERKIGTYYSGLPNRRYTDQINEDRIKTAIQAIDFILTDFENLNSLRPEQVAFARKLIKRAFSLGLNTR